MTPETQTTLNASDKKFWKEAHEISTKGMFVNFVDGEPKDLDIDEWKIHQVDTNWGKKPAIKTVDGKYLKLESKRLCFALTDFVETKCRLRIIRFDSKPNSQNTWYAVSKIE